MSKSEEEESYLVKQLKGTETEKINDIIFTALRTAKGLDLSLIPPEFLNEFNKNATQFEENGIICRNGIRIYIP